jgi:hypothetical protein
MCPLPNGHQPIPAASRSQAMGSVRDAFTRVSGLATRREPDG